MSSSAELWVKLWTHNLLKGVTSAVRNPQKERNVIEVLGS